jgi:hypothetical protein
LKLYAGAAAVLCTATACAAASPALTRVFPLGVARGTEASLEIHGESLAPGSTVEFDCEDLTWKGADVQAAKLAGTVLVSREAAPGPHILRVVGPAGASNSLLLNVGDYPAVFEQEPNDIAAKAQTIALAARDVHGYMDGLADIDRYRFRARAGERWSFDLRSMEYGSHLECKMALLDESGRVIAANDDRNQFDETPFLAAAFPHEGWYTLVLDQYRGPQGVACGKNCGYLLRISQAPVVDAVFPLGAKSGGTARFTLRGQGVETLTMATLAPARRAEHFRMTYPFTMPVRFAADPPRWKDAPRVAGKIAARRPGVVEMEFPVPANADCGLWRIHAAGPHGSLEPVTVEISGREEIDGLLEAPGDEDAYAVDVRAGQPLQARTLAAQLGGRFLDTVLEVRDLAGKVLAENDDVITGQGTVIGNPDSSLVWIPEEDGRVLVCVRDRTGRGGPAFAYRLKIRNEHAGFQLLTSPETVNVPRGGEAELKVHLIREPGFTGPVQVMVEGPAGEPQTGEFRADQYFGPSADGDNVVLPEIAFRIRAPETLAAGSYRIRVTGEGGPDRRRVERHTSLFIGPVRNDLRRPMPYVAIYVYEAPEPSNP